MPSPFSMLPPGYCDGISRSFHATFLPTSMPSPFSMLFHAKPCHAISILHAISCHAIVVPRDLEHQCTQHSSALFSPQSSPFLQAILVSPHSILKRKKMFLLSFRGIFLSLPQYRSFFSFFHSRYINHRSEPLHPTRLLESPTLSPGWMTVMSSESGSWKFRSFWEMQWFKNGPSGKNRLILVYKRLQEMSFQEIQAPYSESLILEFG